MPTLIKMLNYIHEIIKNTEHFNRTPCIVNEYVYASELVR